MRRMASVVFTLCTGLLALAAGAVQAAGDVPGKVYRVGLISYTPAASEMAKLKLELRKFGYWEGDNIVYMIRDGVRNGDPNSGAKKVLEQDVVDMVAWQPDLIVSFITTSSTALKANPNTAKIPVIMWGAEPVESGLADSHRHPGHNFTGFANRHVEDLLIMRFFKLSIPNLKKVALMYNGTYSNAPADIRQMEEAGSLMDVKVTVYHVDRREDFESAIAKMKADGMQAIKVAPHELFNVNGADIGRLALKYGLPATGQRSVLLAGGVMGLNGTRDWGQVGPLVDKVLKGANPADIPFERGNASNLLINMQAAETLGLKIPAELLDQSVILKNPQ